MKWSQSEDQDFEKDERGWEKGKRRKWDQETIDRIIRIRKELEEDQDTDYWGPTAVEVEYRRRFPNKEVPPLRTIGQILKDCGLTKDQKHQSKPGALRYLHYPEKMVYQELGSRVMEADFVGDKYLKGRSKPIHFLGYSCKHEPKLRHYERVKGHTTEEFIETTKSVFHRFERPDVLKIDNAPATTGGGFHTRIISSVMKFLLGRNVYPVYSVPRKPATQASIEGSNSLFARKFWNRHEFESIQEMEERLELFNENTRRYLQYTPPQEQEEPDQFEPKVYFLRQIREQEDGQKGYVTVMNETVQLPREYIKYFVLVEWKLLEERLLVRFEETSEEENDSVKARVLKEKEFPIQEGSKKKCEDLLK